MTGRPPQKSPGATTAPGRSGVRTALLHNPYGLTIREVTAEIRRLSARGWQLWEIRLRFAHTRKDTNE